jgi:competence protein ComEC
MPLIALAVAAYALGLILGFASLHGVTACVAFLFAVTAFRTRKVSWLSFAAMLMAGHAVATERRWRDHACRERLAQADSVRVALLADAAPGSLARGETVEPGCAIRVGLAVKEGEAPYGSVVVATGPIVASGDGLFVKPAVVAIVRGPGILAQLRSRAARALQRDFREDAPLAKALLIADMSDVGPEVRDRFAMAGLVHILSISGLHVTIVATAMLLVLEAVRLPKRYALIAGCALTATYVALIGAPPPAVRSAVMFAALAASRLLQRPTSAWSSLALGAAWPLPGNPRVALDIGWQLTVVGMIALIAAGGVNKRYIDSRFTGWRHKLISEMTTGIIATIVTAPLVAWYFGRMSLIAPLANIAANPVANLLQPTLFLSLALEWWPAASGFVADAARPGLRALDGIASGAASLPGAGFGVAPTLAGSMLAGIAVVAVVTAVRSPKPLRAVTACLVALSGLLWLPLAPRGSGELELHAIDVGQADAIALRTPRGRWVLVDAGGAWSGGDAGRRTVVPYIRARGGEVAAFVLTHPHLDHVGGAAAVLEALRPKAYWDGAYVSPNSAYRASLATAARRGVSWHRVHPGDSLRVDGVLFRVLAPDSAWTVAQDDPNNASTVIMVEFGSVRLLLTGDAEAPEEQWMAERWGDTALRADVLKSGHHGSKTSSTAAFLDAVHPRVAVVSVGAGNTYGLPSRTVMEAYAARGIVTLRTDEIGSIVVSTDGHRIRFAGADGAWSLPP